MLQCPSLSAGMAEVTLRGIKGNTDWGSGNPCGILPYKGVHTQQGYYVKANGNFVRTGTGKVTPGLLNSNKVHGARWNFKSWSGR